MLSQRIARLRQSAGLSQAELAALLRISPSAAGMYEQGRRTPSLDALVTMASVFGVSLDYLITGKESPYGRNAAVPDCPCATCYWKDGGINRPK